MRKSLRKTHRYIWLSCVVAFPLVLAIAWNVRPLNSGESSPENVIAHHDLLPNAVTVATSDIAFYKSRNTPSSIKLLVELRDVMRVPQLAVYVSQLPIENEAMSSIEPSAFFDGEDYVLLTIPKVFFRDSVFILLADNIKRQPVDQIKLDIK